MELTRKTLTTCEPGKRTKIGETKQLSTNIPMWVYVKSLADTSRNRYQLSAQARIGNQNSKIGYLLFDTSEEENTTTYIGAQTSLAYRGMGMAQYLFAKWVQFSLENEYKTIDIHDAQKKAGIIYLAKTFGFELPNNAEKAYASSPVTIKICQKEGDPQKYLLFRTIEQRRRHMKAPVFQNSSDRIIMPEVLTPKEMGEYQIVEQILLNRRYVLPEDRIPIAEEKIEQVLSLFK